LTPQNGSVKEQRTSESGQGMEWGCGTGWHLITAAAATLA